MTAPRAAGAVAMLLDVRVNVVRPADVETAVLEGEHVYAMAHVWR